MVRKLQLDEQTLWKKVADTATPMRPSVLATNLNLVLPRAIKMGPIVAQPKTKAFKIGAKSQTDFVATQTKLASKPNIKMDAKSFGKLTRGKLNPEARLDLHGMTMSEAYPTLQNFILGSALLHRRLVLVITGKGRPKLDRGPIPERRGVLRHNVPIWLRQTHLSSVILEVTPAHQRHGGSGALYVYLCKKR
jgi:DNA-nicking Smr family endonuclease